MDRMDVRWSQRKRSCSRRLNIIPTDKFVLFLLINISSLVVLDVKFVSRVYHKRVANKARSFEYNRSMRRKTSMDITMAEQKKGLLGAVSLGKYQIESTFCKWLLWLNYSFNDLGPIYGFPLTTTSYSPAIPSSATSSGCLFLWSIVNELPPVTPDWLATHSYQNLSLLECFLSEACVFRSHLWNCDDKGDLTKKPRSHEAQRGRRFGRDVPGSSSGNTLNPTAHPENIQLGWDGSL